MKVKFIPIRTHIHFFKYYRQTILKMSSEDLQLEDIVLLQLFKDQIMNHSLDQVKGMHFLEYTETTDLILHLFSFTFSYSNPCSLDMFIIPESFQILTACCLKVVFLPKNHQNNVIFF